MTDSIDTVELAMELEEEFDVSVSGEGTETIFTVGDLVRYIVACRRKKDE